MEAATAKKKKKEEVTEDEVKKVEEEIDEQIKALEPIPLSVERKLSYDGEERTFIQHEMGFLTKIKFFRLLSGTIRLASEDENSSVAEFLYNLLGDQPVVSETTTEDLINVLLRLIELAPDFAEQLYAFALSSKPEDQLWLIEALENVPDEEGFDILDTFIAQNGSAIKKFFTQHLPRLGQRIGQEVGANEVTEQE